MYLRPKDVLHAAREARNNVPRLPALGAHVHERRKKFSVAHAGGLSLAKIRTFVVQVEFAATLAQDFSRVTWTFTFLVSSGFVVRERQNLKIVSRLASR